MSNGLGVSESILVLMSGGGELGGTGGGKLGRGGIGGRIGGGYSGSPGMVMCVNVPDTEKTLIMYGGIGFRVKREEIDFVFLISRSIVVVVRSQRFLRHVTLWRNDCGKI